MKEFLERRFQNTRNEKARAICYPEWGKAGKYMVMGDDTVMKAENLYDLQKIELLEWMYENLSLPELQTIVEKTRGEKFLKT